MGVESKQTAVTGVPLGGIGAGCVEADSSGRFRNITINNNRTPETRIAETPHSYLALRVERPGELYCTLLQEQGDDDALVAPAPRLPRGSLYCRPLYPAAHFRLTDKRCPAKVIWTAFAPIIPFDHEASVLPAFLLSIRIANPTDEPLQIATFFNWENLSGCDALRRPSRPAEIEPMVVEDPDDAKHTVEPRAIGKRPMPEEPPPLEATPRFNALSFGRTDTAEHNADAQYCLAAKQLEKSHIDCLAWDPTSAVERERLWSDFEKRGHLGLFMPDEGAATAGAVCMSFRLAPGEHRRVDFTLAWFAPFYEVGGVQLGNAYTNRFANAMAVAQNALHYAAYYYASVSNWQHRLLESGLPGWINELLIHHTAVLSTNTLYAKSGAFALLESPGHPAAGDSVTSFYAGLPLLLLFPRFQETELALVAERIVRDPAGHVPLRLGMGNLQAPHRPATPDIAAGVRFVLAVCRNYTLTGNLVRVRELYPALQKVMASLIELDRDRDGLPELAAPEATYDGLMTPGLSSEIAGLWCAALRAAAQLAASLQHTEDVARWERMGPLATAAFEKRYWDEALGHYRLFAATPTVTEDSVPAETCHSAQLAGQWYADLLALGTLFDPAHVQRALERIAQENGRPHGLAAATFPQGDRTEGTEAAYWPSHSAAHFTCNQITRGQTDTALTMLENGMRHLRQAGQPMRCWPQQWDLDRRTPRPGNQPRHAAVLAVWHLLYAMQGFLMDLPNRRLRIMPNLPGPSRSLNCVVLTPACLGWMRYQEDRTGGYRQRIHVDFDSPVHIDEIALRIPADVTQFNIVVEIAEGPVDVVLRTQPVPGAQHLLVRPRRPMLATRAISMRITKGDAGAV